MKTLHLLIGMLSLPLVAAALDLDPWPAAKEGQVRHVIELAPSEQEAGLKVELLVGRTELLDDRNQYFFGGSVEKKTLEGWGYSFYEVSDLGPMGGTLMAVPEDAPKVERFITLRPSDAALLRYNSKLPIVVYTPEGCEVRYRIWTAGETKSATVR